MSCSSFLLHLFFFNDTATTEIYTLSLHDALPISAQRRCAAPRARAGRTLSARPGGRRSGRCGPKDAARSEEHTSELQSRQYLVCRLLLEKKNRISNHITNVNKKTLRQEQHRVSHK